MRVIGLAGWSGVGKTTLLKKLIPELNRRGLTVSTVKHAHHAFDIDQPGKDSFEHRHALGRLSPVDLVIVEGFKACSHQKIEVHRAANGKPLLAGAPNIRAIAADLPLSQSSVPVISLDDVVAVADHLLAAAEPIAEVVAELKARPMPARLPSPRRA